MLTIIRYKEGCGWGVTGGSLISEIAVRMSDIIGSAYGNEHMTANTFQVVCNSELSFEGIRIIIFETGSMSSLRRTTLSGQKIKEVILKDLKEILSRRNKTNVGVSVWFLSDYAV